MSTKEFCASLIWRPANHRVIKAHGAQAIDNRTRPGEF